LEINSKILKIENPKIQKSPKKLKYKKKIRNQKKMQKCKKNLDSKVRIRLDHQCSSKHIKIGVKNSRLMVL